MKMLSKFGIREGQQRLFEVMNQTHSFFAGGAITAVTQAHVDGASDVDLKDGSDLDLWVPVFKGGSGIGAAYSQLVMNLICSTLVRLRFIKEVRPAHTKRSNYTYSQLGSCKIASVVDYRHPTTGRKVQVIALFHKNPDHLVSPFDIIREFDLSINRFFVTVNYSNQLLLLPDESMIVDRGIVVSFDALKRRVFTLNPVLTSPHRTVKRIAKYYERGYRMEAPETCCSCKHVGMRPLTLDEAVGFVLAGNAKPAGALVNTVEFVPQTPPRKVTEPVCPPAPERQKPHLKVLTGGGSAIPTPPEITPLAEKPYERYYKDLKPLLGEQLINANVEANGRLQTFRLYESVLRRAIAALGSKGAGKHLLFWRGTARFADYVSDEVIEMIKEMSPWYMC